MQNQQDHTPVQKTQPLVTFIVTCYNLPVSMLCKCIDSILALSLQPSEREIIIVDDGSDESPLTQLQKYQDNIIYLRKANEGVSTARNIGLRAATGQFIQFVDGDDYLIKAPYEHCIDIVRQGQADVVLFDFTHQEGDTTEYEDQIPVSGSEMMRQQNLKGASWLYIFKHSTLGNLSFSPGINYGEDEEFTPQLMLRVDRVVKTTAKAYFYRQHETSAIGNKSEKAIQQRLDDNLQVIINLSKKSSLMPSDERVALTRRVAQLTMDYIYNTIMLTHDRQQLDQRIEYLRQQGLFPLPNRNYTKKYTWFRRMTNSSLGLSILMRTLPLLQKER